MRDALPLRMGAILARFHARQRLAARLLVLMVGVLYDSKTSRFGPGSRAAACCRRCRWRLAADAEPAVAPQTDARASETVGRERRGVAPVLDGHLCTLLEQHTRSAGSPWWRRRAREPSAAEAASSSGGRRVAQRRPRGGSGGRASPAGRSRAAAARSRRAAARPRRVRGGTAWRRRRPAVHSGHTARRSARPLALRSAGRPGDVPPRPMAR